MTKRGTAAVLTANVEAMIAETAYYKAEQRGFSIGHEVEDWLAAEREVHAILSASEPRPAKRRAATAPRATTSTRATKKAPAKKAPRKSGSRKTDPAPETD